jgi:hypothetical protein
MPLGCLGPATVDLNHPNTWNHLGEFHRGMMDSDSNRTDAYSEFCHDNPDHVDAVRDATDSR